MQEIRSLAESLALLPESQRQELIASLTEVQAEELLWDWRAWARPNQLPPEGEWLTWLLLAGRGFGKTRCGAEWVRSIACGPTPFAPGSHRRIALVAETAADARDVMVEGESGILAVHPPAFRPQYEPSKRRLTWPNGAVATLYNATEPDQLRGPQQDAAWCFVAGTLVATPSGDVPIETLKPCDLVLTRKGPRRVLANSRRRSVVGRITFGNRKELVGTAEHPVYLKSGWTRMDRLKIGDQACAIAVSNGAVSAGIGTEQGAALITNALTNPLNRSARFDSTERSGSTISGKFLKVAKFIIATTTRQTTTSTIWSACKKALIPAFISPPRNFAQIGPKWVRGPRTVQIAERNCSASGWPARLDAAAVNRSERMKSVSYPRIALIVGKSLTAAPATIAVSVASTWQRMAVRDVYCLKVEGEPEYFANGILVHNCDELAKWRYAQETWDMLQFGLRLGSRPQQVVTTTPRPIPLLKQLLAAATTVTTRGSTLDNRSNLAPSFLKTIVEKYENTRLGRQELSAEVLDDVPDALWTRAGLDRDRRKPSEVPALRRVVVAIDPAAKQNEIPEEGAATGIVAAGLGEDGRGYVLEDATCRASPNGWARMAVALFDKLDADCIVGEINNGGDMVQSTVRAVRPTAPFKEVTASKGKWVRAEPIAALYEQGRVSHVGTFAALEDEMVMFGPNGMASGLSPDHLDAAVWALTELFPQMTKKTERGRVVHQGTSGYRPHSGSYRS